MPLSISPKLKRQLTELGFKIEESDSGGQVQVELYNARYLNESSPVGWTIGDPGDRRGKWEAFGQKEPTKPGVYLSPRWHGSIDGALLCIVAWADAHRDEWARYRRT